MVDLKRLRRQALLDFVRIAGAQSLEHVVIGAGARELKCDQTEDLEPGRMTEDWDLAVLVKNWEEFGALGEEMTKTSGAPFQKANEEHRFMHSATQIPIDLIPFGGVEDNPGFIVWPESGAEMNVKGLEFALRRSEHIRFEGQTINFASLLLQTPLKAAAYLDRRFAVGSHDLADLVWIFESYESACIPFRAYENEIARETIRSNHVEFEAYGAVLLGLDLRALPQALLRPVRSILQELVATGSLALESLRPRYDPYGGEEVLRKTRELARAVLCGLDTRMK